MRFFTLLIGASALFIAGCAAYFGYPITPQNELIGYMADHMLRLGRVFIQAESEVSAINMVYGAAAAGRWSKRRKSESGKSSRFLPRQRVGPVLHNILASTEITTSDYIIEITSSMRA